MDEHAQLHHMRIDVNYFTNYEFILCMSETAHITHTFFIETHQIFMNTYYNIIVEYITSILYYHYTFLFYTSNYHSSIKYYYLSYT